MAAHANAIVSLDNTGTEMIDQGHFASDIIRVNIVLVYYKGTNIKSKFREDILTVI